MVSGMDIDNFLAQKGMGDKNIIGKFFKDFMVGLNKLAKKRQFRGFDSLFVRDEKWNLMISIVNKLNNFDRECKYY